MRFAVQQSAIFGAGALLIVLPMIGIVEEIYFTRRTRQSIPTPVLFGYGSALVILGALRLAARHELRSGQTFGVLNPLRPKGFDGSGIARTLLRWFWHVDRTGQDRDRTGARDD